MSMCSNLKHRSVDNVYMQNIDELHTTAGTKDLLELHGSLFRVRCLDCDEVDLMILKKWPAM